MYLINVGELSKIQAKIEKKYFAHLNENFGLVLKVWLKCTLKRHNLQYCQSWLLTAPCCTLRGFVDT